MVDNYNMEVTVTAKNNTKEAFDSMKKSIDEVQQSAKDLGTSSEGSIMKGVFAGNMLSKAFDVAVDSIKKVGQYLSEGIGLAEELDTLSKSYEYLSQQAGISGDEMLAKLQEVSQGTATTASLIEASNKALALGVATDTEQMSQLMEIAMVKGQEFGESTQQAFDDLITGLGRGSAQILDNLGIVIDSTTAYKEYASSIGKSVDELTAQEKKQALVNSVIKNSQKDLQEYSNISVSGTQRMNVAFEELKTTIGSVLLPVWNGLCNIIATATTTVNNFIKNGVSKVSTAVDNRKAKVQQFKQEHQAMFNMLQSFGNYLSGTLQKGLENIGNMFSRLGGKISQVTTGAISGLISGIEYLSDAFDRFAQKVGFGTTEAVSTAGKSFGRMQLHSIELTQKVKETAESIQIVSETLSGSGGGGGAGKSLKESAEEVDEELKRTQEAIEFLNKELENERNLARENAKALYEEYGKALEETENKIEKLSKEIVDLQDKMNEISEGANVDLAKNFIKARDSVEELKKEYGDLIGQISSGEEATRFGINTKDFETYVSAMKELEAYKNLPSDLMSSIDEAVAEQDRFNSLSTVEQIIEQRDAKLKEIQTEIDEKQAQLKQEIENYMNYYKERDALDKQYNNLLHQTFEERKREEEAEMSRLQKIISLMQEAGVSAGGGIAGRKAGGGYVAGGSSYLVGEHGPELFTPSTSGMITPNNQITNNNGIEINISGVNVRSESDIQTITDEIVRKIKLEKNFGFN